MAIGSQHVCIAVYIGSFGHFSTDHQPLGKRRYEVMPSSVFDVKVADFHRCKKYIVYYMLMHSEKSRSKVLYIAQFSLWGKFHGKKNSSGVWEPPEKRKYGCLAFHGD
jgi:hypothetical protein